MTDPDIERIVEQAIDEGQRCIIDNTGQSIARRAAELAVAREKERCRFVTSAETSVIAWPINVMDGAEWNILDSTGTRIAVCGYDGEDKSHPTPHAQDCYGSGRRIGWAIVGMIRNLKTKADFWEGQFTESERVRKILDDALTDIQVAVAPTSALPDASLYARIMKARAAIRASLASAESRLAIAVQALERIESMQKQSFLYSGDGMSEIARAALSQIRSKP